MVRTTIVMLAVAFASPGAAAAQPAPAATTATAASPASAAAEVEDPAVRRRVIAEFRAWQSGKIVRARYTKSANRRLTASVVAGLARPLATLGDVTNVTYQSHFTKDGDDYYLYTIACTQGSESVGIGFDHDGAIDYIGFQRL